MTFMEEERDLDYLKDEADWEQRVGFCPECHFVWAVHDNRIQGRTLPFGCPTSETIAREWWGR